MCHFRYHNLVEHVAQWEVGAKMKVFWAVMPSVVYLKIEAWGSFETLVPIYQIYSITSQKIVIFMFIAIRNSDIEVIAVHIAEVIIIVSDTTDFFFHNIFALVIYLRIAFKHNICQIWINLMFTLAFTSQEPCSNIMWVQFYNDMEHLQVADGGGDLPPDM